MPAINTPFSKTVASFVRNLSQQKDMSCSSISRSISKHLVHAVFGKSAPYGGPHSLLLAGEGAMLKSTKRNGKSHLVAKYPIDIYIYIYIYIYIHFLFSPTFQTANTSKHHLLSLVVTAILHVEPRIVWATSGWLMSGESLLKHRLRTSLRLRDSDSIPSS